ncbi:hypothetical protein Poli38472_011126 [Pythium oligandrum]|uniref:ABC transporter domain-containing protein n=1 Tax=Pythium oligandrum TaxID=41045 RepID=A0A8K1CPN2_PYTOL|nr:hypothetical protein Poli38472_011126 [Pythium oligandrum]|eukprot:TMW67506.1 hypothetical protein Poli38472_011126 [Pythium oligandrum]
MSTDPRRLRAENRHLMVSDEYSLLNTILYTSARSILAQGPEALHQHYSNRMEKAMGRALPQMEVRFKNLSLSTDVPVSGNGNDYELPSLANTLKNGIKGLVSGNKDRATKHILKNVSGVFKPGTMTLVLGQPGSGKSALLKMLSGRFPLTKNIQLEGDITYNGTDRFELADRLPQFVTYVTQRDCHYPTLTVKETLQFAHECCGSELPERDERLLNQGTPEENEKAINAARAMYKLYPDVMIKQLGLEHCQDTVVGNAMLRGVSGGERKRVTTGEMEFGNRFVTLMDEISTGLDSAATYDIVKAQRSAAKKLRKTVVIALLQPSPEVFELFDEVLILNKGQVMYHGPREHVMPYFRSLGFLCPPGRDVADFLLDLGTEQQHVYESPGVHGRGFPRAASEYVEIFQQSWLHQRIKDELDSPHDPMHVHDAANHFNHIPEFHQTFWASTLTLMKRESKVILRNKALLRGRAVVVLVMALIYSSLLNQFDPNNIQVVLGTVFPALLFFGLNQTRQIPLYIAAREIFYKQRRANFYRTPSYVLATTVSQIPLALVEVLVFSAIVYWICGFVSDVSAYFVFQLVLFVTNLAFGAWFFFISSLCPNFNVAQPVGMLSMLLYILFAGFLITKDDIPVYFIWLYWLNPVAWGLRSLAINQYMRPEFDVCTYNGVEYCKNFNKRMNVYLLESYNIQTEDHWLGYGILFLAASFVVYMSLAAIVLERVRHESPEMVTIDKDEDDQKMVILSSCTSAEIDFE